MLTANAKFQILTNFPEAGRVRRNMSADHRHDRAAVLYEIVSRRGWIHFPSGVTPCGTVSSILQLLLWFCHVSARMARLEPFAARCSTLPIIACRVRISL